MKIISWNVNGLRAVVKKGEFQKFIKDHNPDILCLQETKAEQGQAEIDLPEYTEYWNSATKKGYSGTAIFSKIKPLNVMFDLPEYIEKKYNLSDKYGNTNQEGRVIAAEYDNFIVVTVYTPNAKDDLSRIPMRQNWDPAFLEYCKELEKNGSASSPQGKPVIFCGDLNVAYTEIDLARPKENMGKKGFTLEERAGFGEYINQGFVDTFRKFTPEGGHYTWWTAWGGARERNVGWRIDYVLVSKILADRVKSGFILETVFGSDHCPVGVEMEI